MNKYIDYLDNFQLYLDKNINNKYILDCNSPI